MTLAMHKPMGKPSKTPRLKTVQGPVMERVKCPMCGSTAPYTCLTANGKEMGLHLQRERLYRIELGKEMRRRKNLLTEEPAQEEESEMPQPERQNNLEMQALITEVRVMGKRCYAMARKLESIMAEEI